MNSNSILDPALAGRMRALELQAREAADGVLAGIHHSPHRGASIEFAEHKPYAPGDEIKLIDWKLYAKSDRFYIKQFEDETNLRVCLLVDGSGSMAYRGQGRDQTKLDYARTAAAAIAYLLLGQSDSVGLGVIGKGLRAYLPPRAKLAFLQEILAGLVQTEPESGTDISAAVFDLIARFSGRGLVFIFSDLLDEPEPMLKALKMLRHRRFEVVLFHVLDPEELEFPFDRLTVFEGMEEKIQLLADPRAMREEYRRQVNLFLEEVKQTASGHGMDYWLAETKTPVAQALSGYLAYRASRRRWRRTGQ